MLLWLISNYDKVTNRRKTVRWLPGKRTGNSNNSIDWMRWIIKPEINRARGYTQLYDFLCSLAESWFFYETFYRFEKKFGRWLGFFQMPIGNLGIFARLGKYRFGNLGIFVRLGKYRLPVLYKEGGKSLIMPRWRVLH